MLLDRFSCVRVVIFFEVYHVCVLLQAGAMRPIDVWRDFARECILSEICAVDVPLQAEGAPVNADVPLQVSCCSADAAACLVTDVPL